MWQPSSGVRRASRIWTSKSSVIPSWQHSECFWQRPDSGMPVVCTLKLGAVSPGSWWSRREKIGGCDMFPKGNLDTKVPVAKFWPLSNFWNKFRGHNLLREQEDDGQSNEQRISNDKTLKAISVPTIIFFRPKCPSMKREQLIYWGLVWDDIVILRKVWGILIPG